MQSRNNQSKEKSPRNSSHSFFDSAPVHSNEYWKRKFEAHFPDYVENEYGARVDQENWKERFEEREMINYNNLSDKLKNVFRLIKDGRSREVVNTELNFNELVVQEGYGHSLLDWAAEKKDEAVQQYFFDIAQQYYSTRENNSKDENRKYPTLLQCAIYCNQPSDALMTIIRHSKSSDYIGNGKASPIHIAARYGNLPALEVLIRENVDVNQLTEDGATPLMEASEYGHALCVERLIELGANVNYTHKYRSTALILAASKGHLPCVRALLAAKADVNHVTEHGLTAIYAATQGRNVECIKAIAAAGLKDVDQAPAKMATPLLFAVMYGDLKCVEALVACGANLNLVLEADHPHINPELFPLELAVLNGDKEMVKLLIELGADASNSRSLNEYDILNLTALILLHPNCKREEFRERLWKFTHEQKDIKNIKMSPAQFAMLLGFDNIADLINESTLRQESTAMLRR